MLLKPFLGIAEDQALVGIHGGSDNPRLCISVVPGRVQWETGKFGWITKGPGEHGAEELRFDYRQNNKLKPGITAVKIIVLIRTKRNDSDSEVPRSRIYGS